MKSREEILSEEEKQNEKKKFSSSNESEIWEMFWIFCAGSFLWFSRADRSVWERKPVNQTKAGKVDEKSAEQSKSS